MIPKSQGKSAKCKVIPLKSRLAIKANVIFSGTVSSYLIRKRRRGSNKWMPMFGAKVKIKKVYRGNLNLQGQVAIIEGLGNPKICLSKPRIGDRRIFFVEPSKFVVFPDPKHHHFRLRSSILHVTHVNLKNLRRLTSSDNALVAESKGKTLQTVFIAVPAGLSG